MLLIALAGSKHGIAPPGALLAALWGEIHVGKLRLYFLEAVRTHRSTVGSLVIDFSPPSSLVFGGREYSLPHTVFK
jgi:hypothetical protein